MISNEASNFVNQEYDMFLSFDSDVEDKVSVLYDILTDCYKIKVCIDDSGGVKLNSFLTNSKIFVSCISKSYPFTRRCIHEVTLAYTNDKPMISLYFEKLTSLELFGISFGLENAIKINFYDDPKVAVKWRGALFDCFIQNLSQFLDRKLIRIKKVKYNNIIDSRINAKPESKFNLVRHSSMYRREASWTGNNNTDDIIQASAIEYIGLNNLLDKRKPIVLDDTVETSLIGLEKFKSNSLFEIVSGFNRMAVCERRNKVYLTSSYNKSVVIIDTNGNWIERRNPNRLLKEPWGIFIRSEPNEIYIGDNGRCCIFVFDMEFNHRRTISEDAITGFYDLQIDNKTNSIYVACMYDSFIGVIDLVTSKLKHKVFVSTPTFIRIRNDDLIIVSSSDSVFVLNKVDFSLIHLMKSDSIKYTSGLLVNDDGTITTTAYQLNEDNTKSKEVHMCTFKIDGESVSLKKLNIGVTQVNDFISLKNSNRFLFICDTHVDIFDYQNLRLIWD